jgi:hypothetical protein
MRIRLLTGAMMLDLRVLPERLSVCRLPAGSELPGWAAAGGFCSVSWTSEETSIVCVEAAVPGDVRSEGGWRALMVAGPLDFDLTGILASVAQPLADASISIFAISTFDTDYVLVRNSALDRAMEVLRAWGHRVG